MATFRFQGQFTYAGAEEHAAAIHAFSEDNGMFVGPPIPSDALRRSNLELALDYERSSENATEWTGLLSQVAGLAENAKDGAIICVYDGPSSEGHKVQRVRLAAGGEMSEDAPPSSISGAAMNLIGELASAHEAIAKSDPDTHSLESAEIDDHLRERGWVPAPLSTEDVARLEELVGFEFSPLLRALFTTKNAMPPGCMWGVFGISEWCGSAVFEKNREIAEAREEYEWDLPKFVAITSDEDFHAVTEDHRVVEVCSNEGNIEGDHGPLEGWIVRYTKAALGCAQNPDDKDAYDRDPEVVY